VHAELREEHGIGVGRVQRLTAAAGLRGAGRRPWPRTTIRVEGVRPALDLVERDFTPGGPNELWCSDLTYIETGEGWLYLAGVLDLLQPPPGRLEHGLPHARRARRRRARDGVAHRRPDGGLVHYSDQGSQYTGLIFGQRCRQAGIDVSMGSKGDCLTTP